MIKRMDKLIAISQKLGQRQFMKVKTAWFTFSGTICNFK